MYNEEKTISAWIADMLLKLEGSINARYNSKANRICK